MQFANLSLLLGGALVSIPIILHLVMRQEPKHFEFPALRFVKQKNVQNQRRLQLKHWILLLLRCCAIIFLVLALALPSVASSAVGTWLIIGLLGFATVIVGMLAGASWGSPKTKRLAIGLTTVAGALFISLLALLPFVLSKKEGTLLGDQEAPVAAVFVFDTSPRMEYEQKNESRLSVAQRISTYLASQLPDDSEIAIVDRATRGIVFATNTGAAQQTIAGLEIEPGGDNIVALLFDALEKLEANEKKRKELYVFSDLSIAAWDSMRVDRLKKRLEELPEVSVYLLDVSAEDISNTSISNLTILADSVSRNTDVFLQAELFHEGLSSERSIELYLEKQDPSLPIIEDGNLLLPEATRRHRQTIKLASEQGTLVPFKLAGLEEGLHHGWVQLTGKDGLAIDDRRWFSVEVRVPWDLLVVEGTNAKSSDLVEALAPLQFRESDRAAYKIEVVSQTKLEKIDLDLFEAVVLLDPGTLPARDWRQLDRFVRHGGGLAVFLGGNADLNDINSEEAQLVMPGKLTRQWRAGQRHWFLSPEDYQHQMLSSFREISTSVPWSNFPVHRHWSFDSLAEDANVIVRYNNGVPALIEQSKQKGTVLVFTTSISDDLATKAAWNELFTGFESWPFFVFSNSMVRYMVQKSEGKFNYLTGQRAVVATDKGQAEKTHLLFTPQGDDPQDVTPDLNIINIAFTHSIGSYRLRAPGNDNSIGFSVNLLPQSTKMAKIELTMLDRILGESRYHLAKTQEEVVREQGEVRVGRKFYPYFLLLTAFLLGLEYAFANRFYQTEF
ncbi:MAG: BatA domain-containing protein [Pirellulales bacterium]